MAAISIHAELLLNIRQITIQASLPTNRNATTSVDLSSRRECLSVFHDGEVAEISLPATVRAGYVIRIDPGSSRDISLRLPVAEGAIDRSYHGKAHLASPPIWSASSMTPNTRISCRNCHVSLLKDPVRVWKDLPSEHWAEMMDLWHCHKPDTDDTSTHHLNGLHKGYGAASALESNAGAGLLDAMHVLLSHEDVNIAIDSQSSDTVVSVYLSFVSVSSIL